MNDTSCFRNIEQLIQIDTKRADFLILKTGDHRDLFYYFGENLVEQTFVQGKVVRASKNPVIE